MHLGLFDHELCDDPEGHELAGHETLAAAGSVIVTRMDSGPCQAFAGVVVPGARAPARCLALLLLETSC